MGLNYDFSAATGRNRIDYKLTNSVNASFGPESPTEFDVGGLKQDERNLNADFVYNWNSGFFPKPINIAFGAEIAASILKFAGVIVIHGTSDRLLISPLGRTDFQAGAHRRSSMPTATVTPRMSISTCSRWSA